MNRLDKLEKTHQEAMSYIKEMQSSDKPEMRELTKFLLETDVNSYSFMPNGWEGSIHTSTGLEAFLMTVHHAIFDDGDISFPIVNGEPRISFVWKNEDNYDDLILSAQDKHLMKSYGSTYQITQCSDVFDFIKKNKEYHVNRIRKYFIEESASHGIDFAKKHFSQYSNFNPEWEFDNDILQKIEELKKSPRFKM